MNVFRYPARSLVGDYLRAGVGLAVGLAVLANAAGSITLLVIFGGLTALFGGFAYRTAQRHLLRVAVTAEAIPRVDIHKRNCQYLRLNPAE